MAVFVFADAEIASSIEPELELLPRGTFRLMGIDRICGAQTLEMPGA